MSEWDPSAVDAALALLRSRSERHRKDGAVQMRAAVDMAAREMSPETFSHFEDALFKRIFEMVRSAGNNAWSALTLQLCVGSLDRNSRETRSGHRYSPLLCVCLRRRSVPVCDGFMALAAMDALIESTSSGEAETKIIKFANTLSKMISTNTDTQVLELVALTLGHLAHASVVPNTDYVEFEASL